MPKYSSSAFAETGSAFMGVAGRKRKTISKRVVIFKNFMFSNFGESIEFDEIMQNAGGDSNAFTTQDTTQYYNVAPTKQLELMIYYLIKTGMDRTTLNL